MGKAAQRRNEEAITQATDAQLADAKAMLADQRTRLDDQKQRYREFEITNPFAGMENPYEDLTVSQEAARFQAEQGRQQRANIMANLQGAAGASGIAGLAQSLAGQGVMQARQISTDIAQQEVQNRMAAAQGQMAVDQLVRQGAGAVQQAQFGRESTLYAAELGEMAGTRSALSGAQANQMAGFSAISQMNAARMGVFGDIIGGVAGGIATGGMSNLAKGLSFFGKE